GVCFTELEDIACAVGDEVTRELIETPVRHHAEVSAEHPPERCPVCREPQRLSAAWDTACPGAWNATMRSPRRRHRRSRRNAAFAAAVAPVPAGPSGWSEVSWPAGPAARGSARWCIRRPDSGTAWGPRNAFSWALGRR